MCHDTELVSLELAKVFVIMHNYKLKVTYFTISLYEMPAVESHRRQGWMNLMSFIRERIRFWFKRSLYVERWGYSDFTARTRKDRNNRKIIFNSLLAFKYFRYFKYLNVRIKKQWIVHLGDFYHYRRQKKHCNVWNTKH